MISISGTLLYCSTPVPSPVSNVKLTVTGNASDSTLSDGSGNYWFTGLPSGRNYTVTPTKAARVPGSPNINTVDVIAVPIKRTVISGSPEIKSISTSYVKRQNLTTPMRMRRLTRLTNAFSKKMENFEGAVAPHFAYYNFVRMHKSLRMTAAGGVTDTIWSVTDPIEAA